MDFWNALGDEWLALKAGINENTTEIEYWIAK
jgi:hypothetical protein